MAGKEQGINLTCPGTGAVCEGRLFLTEFREGLQELVVGVDVNTMGHSRRPRYLGLIKPKPEIQYQYDAQAHIERVIDNIDGILKVSPDPEICRNARCGSLAELILVLAASDKTYFNLQEEPTDRQ